VAYYSITIRGTTNTQAVYKALNRLPRPRGGKHNFTIHGASKNAVTAEGYVANATTTRDLANIVSAALADDVAIEVEHTRTFAWGVSQLNQGDV